MSGGSQRFCDGRGLRPRPSPPTFLTSPDITKTLCIHTEVRYSKGFYGLTADSCCGRPDYRRTSRFFHRVHTQFGASARFA